MKPNAKLKKDVPEDDQENQDDYHSHGQETIKKEYIEEMFQRHFKTMLGPQDDSEEPSIHPAIADMDAVRIIETIDVLQAMLHHQQQLLDLYNAKAHQDACYTPISEQKCSKPKTYGDIQGEAKVDKKRTMKIIQHMLKVPEETSYQERIQICRREEIWQERHLHIYNAIETKEEGKLKEEEMKKFWWSMNSDNFTFMYGQKVDALADQKISAEEANKAAREAQEDEVEEEEDLSKEMESSEEEDHHMEDIAEDKLLKAVSIMAKAVVSSHLIGSEKGVFDKKMSKGSVNTAHGEKKKIKCEGKVNVSHFAKRGYVSKRTLSVKVVEGLKIKLFCLTTALANGWKMNGYKQKNGDVVIMLTHDRYPAIIFDQMIKCGSSILMGAKMKIFSILQGINLAQEKKMSKKSFHQKTGHATNAYLQDTAKYYEIELSGTIPTCVSCSIKNVRQKISQKKIEAKAKHPVIKYVWIYHKWLKHIQEEVNTGPQWLMKQPSLKRLASLKGKITKLK